MIFEIPPLSVVRFAIWDAPSAPACEGPFILLLVWSRYEATNPKVKDDSIILVLFIFCSLVNVVPRTRATQK